MALFVDLDGVLADMDTEYERCFGATLGRIKGGGDPPRLWENIIEHGSFYRGLPLMPDAMRLWTGVKILQPTILTGVPTSVPHAADDKRVWVVEHFGADVPVICCRSKDKRNHGKPGDILIDDWERYAPLWKGMGGHFILHRSAEESLAALAQLL